jgi:hypothetical protein
LEASGSGTEAWREAGAPHDILNCIIDVVRTRVAYSSWYTHFSVERKYAVQVTSFIDFFHFLCYAKNGS